VAGPGVGSGSQDALGAGPEFSHMSNGPCCWPAARKVDGHMGSAWCEEDSEEAAVGGPVSLGYF
jgi:hypothetical protein